MANPDRPGLLLPVQAAQIEVAAGVDRVAPAWLQLARGKVDRQPFRDGSQIQQQGTSQRDRVVFRIDRDVAVTDPSDRFDHQWNRCTRSMLAIEPSLLQRCAQRGIESAGGYVSDVNRKPHGFEQQRTDRDRRGGMRRQATQLTPGIEACADLLDGAEPFEGAVDCRGFCLRRLDGDRGPHQYLGADRHAGYLAWDNASETASWKASLLSVAPET